MEMPVKEMSREELLAIIGFQINSIARIINELDCLKKLATGHMIRLSLN